MKHQRARRGPSARLPATLLLATLVLATLAACDKAPPEPPPLFDRLAPEVTGVTFANDLPREPSFNILNYLYYYNGAGVAVGDIDGDSLPDLYFSSNLGKNRLYRNLGNYRFEDITDKAGVAGPDGWKTGVTMADVNGDGRLDLYVSAVSYLESHGHNVLYINNGDGTFSDRTEEFGLGHAGYSTQAVFFDYDGDGDLDMYLLNHSTHTERASGSPALRRIPHPTAGDRLFRNDGQHFTDVSAAAGIYQGVEGYGLGVAAADLDLDGCIDLYISNDFQENDYLYHNNCDGTFTESIARATKHTSRFSMGVDAADMDNDGRPDLVVLDMLPEREDVLKTSASSEGFSLFDLRVRAGYWPQYARNTLQLNRGGLRFSEIGYQAGVAATDWSWAALFADLDDDGRKDLFITNGIVRRPNDLDYINYVSNEAVQASLATGVKKQDLALLDSMPSIPLANVAFHNDGDYHFSNRAAAWGLADPGFSNGVAYVDLNNSGMLDLVVNNINAPASIYRNRAHERTGNASLSLRLRGAGANTAGIGARVSLTIGPTTQLLEQMLTRGFLSSVDPKLHFGVGKSTRADSLVVVWPDRRRQVLRDVALGGALTLYQDSATVVAPTPAVRAVPLLGDVTDAMRITSRHVENDFLDYDREPLMPHRLSSEGPALASGDVNGDGLDDLYVGGAKWHAGTILLQQDDGTFRPSLQRALAADSIPEDVDAVFFDADGDGDQDLYVVSAGNEFWGDMEQLDDRLYLNDGHGTFTRSTTSLPPFHENGGCVVPGDFDGDGDIDLFVGSRVVSRRYGETPRSHLLQNDGYGHFRDVTESIGGGMGAAGMVSSGTWIDYDGDGHLDLVVVGEWMPVRVYHQEAGVFHERTQEAGLAGSEGWWNSVAAADLNGDGRPDLVLGNLGLNSYLRASATEPARLYVGDFFTTGSLKQILTFYNQGVSYPVAGRDELVRLMPALRQRYPSYKSFGAARIEDILPSQELAKATILRAHTFRSAVALSTGIGFTLAALPPQAQFFPVYASLVRDVDGDGRPDILLGGNFYGVPPVFGRYDAGYGLLLHGNGDGTFHAVDMAASGVDLEGEVRELKLVRRPGGRVAIAVARNNDTLRLLATEKR
ncbi:MAG: VCBS repeat-containing protein [Gemmatimonadota bacterium]